MASAALTFVLTRQLVREATRPISKACVPKAIQGLPALLVRRTMQPLTAVCYCAPDVLKARCGKLANGCTRC